MNLCTSVSFFNIIVAHPSFAHPILPPFNGSNGSKRQIQRMIHGGKERIDQTLRIIAVLLTEVDTYLHDVFGKNGGRGTGVLKATSCIFTRGKSTPLKINMEHSHGGLEDHFPL